MITENNGVCFQGVVVVASVVYFSPSDFLLKKI